MPPAPPWRVGGASGAALEVLTDFERAAPQHEAAAFALWKALRDVHLWHTLPPERRARSFPGGRSLTRADLDAALADCPELASAWAAFARLLDDGVPVDAPDLAAACHAVYAWTEQRSLLDTAAHFAEAAALLSTEDPGFANDAGWACRRAVLHDRSEIWYDRGMVLAVKQEAQEDAVRILQGLGSLRKDQGRTAEARELYEEAVRRAAWTKKRRVGARAQHHLFALVAETGSLEEGLVEAERALDLYPVYDFRLPYLAADFALLLNQHRYFSLSYPLLERVVLAIPAHERLLALGSLSVAAAATGRWEQFRSLETTIQAAARTHPEHASPALVLLAEGAWHTRDRDKALRYLDHASRGAHNPTDAIVLEAIRRISSAMKQKSGPAREVDTPESGLLTTLSHRFNVRMRRWMAPERLSPEPPPSIPEHLSSPRHR